MKKNESKVTNLVATKVAEQLEGIKNSKTLRLLLLRPKRLKRNWYKMLKKLPLILPMPNW